MFENLLTPQYIVNFLKNNADIKKMGLNLINSEEGKKFIEQDLGYDYQDFKQNLTNIFINTKKSNSGMKKQQEVEDSKKLENYKNLANKLIKDHGLSLHSGIILAAGFVGIDKQKVREFLKQKGYSASKEFVSNYYSKNENFLKSLMKSDGVIVPGWNDQIEANDLEIEITTDKGQKDLVQVPDDDLQEEFKK